MGCWKTFSTEDCIVKPYNFCSSYSACYFESTNTTNSTKFCVNTTKERFRWFKTKCAFHALFLFIHILILFAFCFGSTESVFSCVETKHGWVGCVDTKYGWVGCVGWFKTTHWVTWTEIVWLNNKTFTCKCFPIAAQI